MPDVVFLVEHPKLGRRIIPPGYYRSYGPVGRLNAEQDVYERTWLLRWQNQLWLLVTVTMDPEDAVADVQKVWGRCQDIDDRSALLWLIENDIGFPSNLFGTLDELTDFSGIMPGGPRPLPSLTYRPGGKRSVSEGCVPDPCEHPVELEAGEKAFLVLRRNGDRVRKPISSGRRGVPAEPGQVAPRQALSVRLLIDSYPEEVERGELERSSGPGAPREVQRLYDNDDDFRAVLVLPSTPDDERNPERQTGRHGYGLKPP
jgi:hypothetical protein